jgi:hypothetical protein
VQLAARRRAVGGRLFFEVARQVHRRRRPWRSAPRRWLGGEEAAGSRVAQRRGGFAERNVGGDERMGGIRSPSRVSV